MNPGITSKYFSGTNTFFARLAEAILRFRWLLLLLVFFLTIFSFYEMRTLRMDNSNEAFFLEGNPTKLLLDKFRDTFGNEDLVYVLIETDDFFKADTIRLIRKLAEDLEAHVPYVKDMKFLGNVEYVEGVEGGIEISDLIENIPEIPDEMKLVRERAMNEPLYLDNLISRDGKTSAILLERERYPEEKVDPRKEIPPAVYKILAKPEYADLKVYAVGTPIIDYEMDEMTARELSLFGLVCLGLQMLILLWVARGARGVVTPLLVVILSIFWTLGLVGILDWTLSLMVAMLPIFLICVGIGDSMHIISEFQDQQDRGLDRSESIVKALALVGIPCLLTSITTAAGFLSFWGTVLKPIREMGIYAAIGVIMAFLLSLIIVPAVFSFGKNKKKGIEPEGAFNPVGEKKKSPDYRPVCVRLARTGRNDIFDRVLKRIALLNLKHPWAILCIFILMAAFSLFGYRLIEVETNSIEFASTDLPVRQAYDYVDSHMGGSMSMEVMLDTGKKDGIKEIEFLRDMETLQNYIDRHPLTSKTTSVIDTIKKMRRAMHENRMEYYTLPETSAQASEYLFLYETSGGEDLDKQVSFNYDIARITARTKSLNSKDVRTFTSDISMFVKKNINPSTKVEYTGTMPFIEAMSNYVAQGQKRSFILAFLAITCMMIIVLRSFKLGLISMIPNVFPVLISLGLMGFAGVYLNIPLMILSPIIIGVAVDDTIHFFMRYRREFNRTGTYEGALKATLSTVGRPIMFTTMTLVLGFSVFGLSDMYNVVQFGLLAAFAFLWALLADFFLAPAMMLLFKPLGAERQVSMVN
ncbi:MAG: MMPL family transporter [Thermodesulfobacteriota bacterium]|nr:MMPL family transporter [Thermodesulfobacteriota bacterium]